MGPSAFSAPETRNVRDFLASRVVNGRQQIRTAITFHESGRLVMWPYGYTYADVPSDMTTADHSALAIIGKHMASTNGYKPEQASDLYLTSGTTRDYEYGVYRIFSYTFELSVKDYPDDSLIASETGRSAANASEFNERFTARIRALARLQDLAMGETGGGAPLHALVHSQFEAFVDPASGRVNTEGPDVRLTAHAAARGRYDERPGWAGGVSPDGRGVPSGSASPSMSST